MGLGVAGDGGGAGRPTCVLTNCGQIFRVLDIWTLRVVPSFAWEYTPDSRSVARRGPWPLTLDGKAQDHDVPKVRQCIPDTGGLGNSVIH